MVTVDRRGDLSIAEVAIEFRVAEETVCRWIEQADVDEGIKDGQSTADQSEAVQLRRLEMRIEILRPPAA